MERVLALVEGFTEEQFIKQVLQPHLWPLGVDLQCTLVYTAKDEGRRVHRGGVTSYERIRRDVLRLLRSKPRIVTTLFDVYGFPNDLPGYPEPWPTGTTERVRRLSSAFEKNIGDANFFAGFLAHEFEGLLFSDPARLASAIQADLNRLPGLSASLEAIRNAFPTPEDINDGAMTAPSKRILALTPSYEKRRHGPQAAESMGLQTIRTQCRLFDNWLKRLEGLGQAPPSGTETGVA